MARPKLQWRPFEETRAFVHTLHLKSSEEWKAWAKTANKPEDIPRIPNKVYKQEGWKGWGDFLGTGNVASIHKKFCSFEEAHEFALRLGLKNISEWHAWAKSKEKPSQVPSCPDRFYKNQGWTTWGDWLGTGNIASTKKVFVDFETARTFAQKLNINTMYEWKAWVKTAERPEDIPASPNSFYKEQWKGWGNWLGTGNIAPSQRNYRDFESTRVFVQALKLKSIQEWKNWAKSVHKPENIPSSPDQVYLGKGWNGWSDWLGIKIIAPQNKVFLNFEEARSFAQSLLLKNCFEWKTWAKTSQRPADIPASPQKVYHDKGWKGWGDWLGTGNLGYKENPFLDFKTARTFAVSLNLESRKEWKLWVKSGAKPKNIPADPKKAYHNKGWVSWGHWLGTGILDKNYTYPYYFRPFKTARLFARKLQLKSAKEWFQWASTEARPKSIPSAPNTVYKDEGWISWGDWLGTKRISSWKRQYLPFEEARNFARSLNLKSSKEWLKWKKGHPEHKTISANPSIIYANKGWKGWGDFLGTGNIARENRVLKTFQEARAFVHTLHLKNSREWTAWAKTKDRPHDIPASPHTTYKNKGWSGWSDWLGTSLN